VSLWIQGRPLPLSRKRRKIPVILTPPKMLLLGLDILVRREGRDCSLAAARRRSRSRHLSDKLNGVRAEVPAWPCSSIRANLRDPSLGPHVRKVDLIATTVMAHRGSRWISVGPGPLTPVVNSIRTGRTLRSRVNWRGELVKRGICGSRATVVPRGDQFDHLRVFMRHEKSLMRRAYLVGHLSPFSIGK